MILLRVVDLAPEKSAVREALRAPWAVATPETLSRRRNRAGWPGKRPCRDVSTLPALSIGAPTYPLGFSGKPFSTAGLGSVLAIGRDGWAIFQINKSVPAKPAHLGDAGWEDRIAIRGGRRPRAGGAKPQEAVLFFLFDVASSGRPKVIHSLALVLIYGFRVVLRDLGGFIAR